MHISLKPALLALSVSLLASSAASAQDADRTVTIAFPYQFDNLDACNSSSEPGLVVGQNVAESLTYLSPVDGSISPRLATAWEQIEPTVWRLSIREGVSFHDGAPLDAEAVAASINRMFKPDLDCLNRFKLFSGITLTPTVVDQFTLDISTEQPQVLMPVFLSFVSIDSPNSDQTRLVSTPIGTGPYRVEPRTGMDDIVLTRFDDYWGEQPDVERAIYKYRDESAVRAAMVQVGEADLALAIALQDANNPETDFGHAVGETTRVRFTFKPPLDDIRVRRAFNLAVDRELLRDALFGPDFQIATQMFGPNINGYNPDLEPWPYDPEEARRLIEEARADGVPVETEVPLISMIDFYPSGREAMEAMIAMWAEVGLNVRLESIERAQWLKIVNKPFAEDRSAMILQESHGNTNGDATFTMRFRYHTDGQQSEFSDPHLDELIESAEQAKGEERVELFGEANRYTYAEIVPDVLMFHMVEMARVSPRLDFRPTDVTTSLLELSKIHFAD